MTDAEGRPRVLLLSPGNVNDIALAPALLAAVGPINRLIADKAYDANSLRQLLAAQGAKAVIPSTTSRNKPIPYNKTLSATQPDRTNVCASQGLPPYRHPLRQAR